MKRLFLVDAYALIFRYYYAFLGRPMRNKDGMNTSVVFGFAKFLRDLLRREKPDLLGVAFDPKGGCFRRELYSEYKANRSATPEDILLSVPYVKRLVEAMCIPILEVKGFEADDVIGTLSLKGEQAGYEVFMVTPDKDYGQLVSDHCRLYRQKGDQIEIIDREAIEAKYGITDPALVRDILAIWGDASDNIPGVAGIGEKGACKLVQEWGSVESILENIESIKGKQREKIEASEAMLRLSKELTTIRLDVPIEFNPEALTICSPDTEALRELYREMDFHSFLAELGGADTTAKTTTTTTTPPPPPAPSGELDLFSVVSESAPIQSEEEQPEFATASTTPHTYRLVESGEELRRIVEELMSSSEIAIDTETTGLDPHRDRLIGISLSVRAHEGWYIPIDKGCSGEYREILRPLVESEKIAKIGHNIKFDLMILRQFGLEMAGRLIDTMLLHYLLDAESRHKMDLLSRRYLNYSPIEIETLIGRGARQITMDMVGIDRVAEYAAEDADVTFRLKEVLYPMVEQQGLMKLYDTIEEPLIRVLADMELTGVSLDREALATYSVELTERLSKLSDQIREEAGDDQLNINSSIQLGDLLFSKMKIAEKPKLTKTKRYCTDEEYLQSFAGKFPIIDNILEYRGLKKLLSTYVDALPELINPTTGRIHTTYNQAVTATGRLSSSNPNLQNIPIREEIGRPIRAAFVPSDGEHVVLSADYSQVELRIMAHLSKDEGLVEAFQQGVDIHTATAAKLFSKSLEEVTSEERRRAKMANFGIIYGVSAFGLSQRLDIPRGEARALIDGYFATYPGVKSYMERVVDEARQTECVETIFGRRRYLREINSRNAVARGMAERNAINAPIQGSAADVMKLAMVGIYNALKEEGLSSKITMQVHDEVVIDTLRSEVDRVREIVVERMERAVDLMVELTAECGVGDSWLSAH